MTFTPSRLRIGAIHPLSLAALIRPGQAAVEHGAGDVARAGLDIGQHPAIVFSTRDVDQFEGLNPLDKPFKLDTGPVCSQAFGFAAGASMPRRRTDTRTACPGQGWASTTKVSPSMILTMRAGTGPGTDFHWDSAEKAGTVGQAANKARMKAAVCDGIRRDIQRNIFLCQVQGKDREPKSRWPGP